MKESRQEQQRKAKRKLSSLKRKQGKCYQWKAEGQWTKGDACSFRHDGNKRGTSTRSSSPAPEPQTQNDGKISSALGGRCPSAKRHRRPSKDFLSGTHTNSSCDSWHPPVCQNYRTESGCKSDEKCSFVHREAGPSAKQTTEKELWQRFCCLIEAYSRTLSRRNPSRFCGWAQNSWDQRAACFSQRVHHDT